MVRMMIGHKHGEELPSVGQTMWWARNFLKTDPPTWKSCVSAKPESDYSGVHCSPQVAGRYIGSGPYDTVWLEGRSPNECPDA